MADSFRVNGAIISWPDIITKVFGQRFTGLAGISYGDKRERVKAYGQGRHYTPRGRTRGKYVPDPVKLTFYKDSAQVFRALLASRSTDGVSYGNVEFPLVIQYVTDTGTPMHLQFFRCTVAGDMASDDESSDPSKDEIECDVMKIVRNGLTLFDSTQGAP